MAPRKRAKASAASTPLTEPQPKTPQDSGPATQSHDPSSPANEDRLNDPWTNDQETQLFKSMIKWKPTGMHKHFRMISIHNNMRSLGFATDDAQHTRIPGVWRKLHQLYDLHALDERENSYAFHDLPDPLDPEDAYQIPEFELPEEDFGELMWQQRFRRSDSQQPSSSPPYYPIDEEKALYQPGRGLLRELPEGAKPYRTGSASAATPTPKNNKITRASRAATKAKGTKGGQAKNTKAQSAVSESAGEDEEDEPVDDDDEDEEEEEEEEESAESQVETAPSTRRTNRSGGRAKPAPKRTRKR